MRCTDAPDKSPYHTEMLQGNLLWKRLRLWTRGRKLWSTTLTKLQTYWIEKKIALEMRDLRSSVNEPKRRNSWLKSLYSVWRGQLRSLGSKKVEPYLNTRDMNEELEEPLNDALNSDTGLWKKKWRIHCLTWYEKSSLTLLSGGERVHQKERI